MQKFIKYLLLILLSLSWKLANADQLSAVHLTTIPGGTEISFELREHIPYHVFTLDNPTRLVVDFPKTYLAGQIHNNTDNSSVVENVRTGRPEPSILRVVFDLQKMRRPQIHFVRGNKNRTSQLIIDLYDPGYIPHPKIAPVKKNITQTEEKLIQQAMKEETQENAAKITPILPPLAIKVSGKPIVVVIDPGHGGKDPGTTGHLGVREKNIVMSIAMNLYQELKQDPRFLPILTRQGDTFLKLRQRMRVAQENHADVFIAIHADTYPEPYYKGASIYALSSHGASSEAAEWLAQKENTSELNNGKTSDKNDQLKSVLLDLSQTATISSSIQLGDTLLKNISKIEKVHNKKAEQAPFMVLKSPDIPSVLVETGFLSNISDEKRLRNPLFQMQMAKALYAGLVQYFTENPVVNSAFATENTGHSS